MRVVTIHESGEGQARLVVDSHGNGLAYNAKFGTAGGPMRNVFVQGDAATELRDYVDALEAAHPHKPSRDLWLESLDP